jgi:hypothetical protein
MSEHVHIPHTPHDSGPGGLARWVAIFTAIVATCAALIGHQAEEIANEAILVKNEALLKKTDAADQWAYYQAVSTKSHLMELAMTLVEESRQPPFKDKIAKYEQQKDEIQAKANQLEAASTKANDESTALGIPRERLMYALALLQIAISIGSVTILTGQRWLFAVALISSVGGLASAGFALLAH